MNRARQRVIACHERIQRALETVDDFETLRRLVADLVEHAGFEVVVLRSAVEDAPELERRLLDALGSHALLLDLMDSCLDPTADFETCRTKAKSYFQLHRAALDQVLLPALEERLSPEADRALELRIDSFGPRPESIRPS